MAFTAAARPIAQTWFNSSSSNRAVLEQALRVVAVFLALRWPVALYSGVLTGVQRMDVLNVTKVILTSIRLVGGICVILVWRDLAAFLQWTLLSAVAEVLTYAAVCRRFVPAMDWRPGFSVRALRDVWVFSVSMNALAVLSVMITQVDRLLISRMLPLEALGYYSLAYHAATSISVVLSALSSALMPSLAAAHGAQERGALLRRYDVANRTLLFATGVILFALVFFGEPLLATWVNPSAAANSWRPLALLAAGFWLGAAYSNAYTAAVACRQTGLVLTISAVSALPYLALSYWLISAWGITGAAVGWLLLNASYLVTLVPAVHRRILGIPTESWFRQVVQPLAIVGLLSFGAARLLAESWGLSDVLTLLLLLPAVLVYVSVGQLFLGVEIRADAMNVLRRAAKSVAAGL